MEYAECEAVVKDFPPFREAMKKRGIEDMDLVMVDPWSVSKVKFSQIKVLPEYDFTLCLALCVMLWSMTLLNRCAGYHSEADAPSRRLAKPLIFCRTESDCPMENGYARPVEGIHVLVDMQNMVVLEFEDRKLVPLPPADPLRNYTPGETRGGVDRSDVKPLQIIQPEGPSFRVNGHFVEWQKVLAYFRELHHWIVSYPHVILILIIFFFLLGSGISVLVLLPRKVWLSILSLILTVAEAGGL